MSAYHRKTELPICSFCDKSVSAGSTKCPTCGAALGGRDAASPAERASSGTLGDVKSMLDQGRKIDAVRIYGEQTGAGLREATLAVEALARIEKSPAARTFASRTSWDANLKADLWALIQHGRKIEAIDLYREQTGESVQRARDAIEVLGREHGVLSPRAGCFGLIVLCLVFPPLLAFIL
jgi:ribosomal protein L7/L12